MQQLVSRKVEIAGAKEGELTTLEYDTKGKLVNKSSIRIYQDQLWTLDYSQVGYVANYIQSIGDEANRISEQRVFDHADELKEIHSHLYDRDNRLLAVVAQNPEDSVLFRIEYKYDYLGNIIEEKHFEGEDTLVAVSVSVMMTQTESCKERSIYGILALAPFRNCENNPNTATNETGHQSARKRRMYNTLMGDIS
jgi:hypothetical protein